MNAHKPTLLNRISSILQAGINAATTSQGRNHLEEVQLCSEGYAEPGYSDPDSGVIAFGNWNSVSRFDGDKFQTIDDAPARVASLMEKAGVKLEWSDEWSCCDQCGKAVRTKPDCYAWQPYYWDNDGHISCGDCLEDDPADYLEYHEGRDDRCLTISIDPEEHGYVLLQDDFQHGFHPGQNADPKLIAEALRDQGIERCLFRLDNTSQFDISFSVFVHEDELSSLDHDAFDRSPKNGPSVAAGVQQALQDASEQMCRLPNVAGHAKVAKCDPAIGTARVKLVTPEELLEGNALDF